MSARKPCRSSQTDARIVQFGEESFTEKKSEVADLSAARGGEAFRFWHDGVLHEMTMKIVHQRVEEDSPIPLMYRHPND